jgi:hypothetical protein
MGTRSGKQPPSTLLLNNQNNNNNNSSSNNRCGGSVSSTPVSFMEEEESTGRLLRHHSPFNGVSLLQHHQALPPKYPTIPTTSPSKNNTLTSTDSKLRNRVSRKYGRYRKRVVFKNGDINLSQTNISKRRRRYLADIFTTLVDIQWRWTLLLFTLSFLLSWLFFAMIWWLISFAHGDLDLEHLPDEQDKSSKSRRFGGS